MEAGLLISSLAEVGKWSALLSVKVICSVLLHWNDLSALLEVGSWSGSTVAPLECICLGKGSQGNKAPIALFTLLTQMGLICRGQKRFRKALELLHNVVTTPMSTINAIAVEAYKKYILVSLIHLGQVPYITTALMDVKLGMEGRKDLFDWLSRQLSRLSNFPDAVNLLKPTAFAMTDKSADVQKQIEVCIGEIFRVCGLDAVCRQKLLVPPLVFVKNLAELLSLLSCYMTR
ncbi:Protein MOR1 [Camellia lanceoleosa]|uniref:Protein MOR1 n=1 Tax=Camellia lanceoleosa TaxID=1840588 RepID=A0ACC0GA96_9ERIC|nr:Protein MOR1 [Camellia lanceoleosa]